MGKASENEADAGGLYCAGLFTEDHDGETMPKLSKVGSHCFCELSGKGPVCVTGARNDRLLFLWPLNCVKSLFLW
jgi:hypothetical protein